MNPELIFLIPLVIAVINGIETNFKETVKWNFCRDINKYKEILYFNNY